MSRVMNATRVAILSLMSTLLSTSLVSAAPVLFVDNFDTLDATLWSASDNGYPAPAVSASGGVLHMGQPGTRSQDFPYVHSLSSLFPASGDVSLTVGFQYTGVGFNGDGFVVLDSSNTAVLSFWQDSSGLFVGGHSLANSTDPHEVEFRLVGGLVTTLLDGSVLGSHAIGTRPSSIWFGHPTVGQILDTAGATSLPGRVDSDGTVLSRWWSPNIWSTFNLDFVRIEALDTVPEPGSLSLFGLGLVGLGILRRRHRDSGNR